MNISEVFDRKSSEQKIRLIKSLVLLVLIVTVLTVGEISGNPDIPSWSGALGYYASQQTVLSDTDLVVHFIDVGQGDATLVQSGEYNILIDAGENGKGRVIAEYLDEIGVSKLDWVIATHPHSDHMGGMDDVLRLVRTDNVMFPVLAEEYIPLYSFYTSVIDIINEKNIPVTYAKSGDSFTLGGLTLDILHPEENDYRIDLNDLSMCMNIRCGDIGLLLCGDITYEIEDELLEAGRVPKATVLHVIHHGSALSNSREFIASVDPDFAVISCGESNEYGHPHASVLETLNKLDIEYFRTDKNGTVVISFTGDGIKTETEK